MQYTRVVRVFTLGRVPGGARDPGTVGTQLQFRVLSLGRARGIGDRTRLLHMEFSIRSRVAMGGGGGSLYYEICLFYTVVYSKDSTPFLLFTVYCLKYLSVGFLIFQIT